MVAMHNRVEQIKVRMNRNECGCQNHRDGPRLRTITSLDDRLGHPFSRVNGTKVHLSMLLK
jgi:hypothetical protein